MSALLPGPYRTLISLANGIKVPYYVIPFDKQCRCVGPMTRRQLSTSCLTYRAMPFERPRSG